MTLGDQDILNLLPDLRSCSVQPWLGPGLGDDLVRLTRRVSPPEGLSKLHEGPEDRPAMRSGPEDKERYVMILRRAYVYFTHGMHWMLNGGSARRDPTRRAIRSIEPIAGIEPMAECRKGMVPYAEGPAGGVRLCLSGSDNGQALRRNAGPVPGFKRCSTGRLQEQGMTSRCLSPGR